MGTMAKRKANLPNWSACKSAIKDWPTPGLRALIQELYKLSDENRRFLHGRLLPQAVEGTITDAVRALGRLISPSAVWNGHFRHADAKRVVDQFAKATDDPAAVAHQQLEDQAIS
jgi:hypothetical protein